jgi:hypothetical protein
LPALGFGICAPISGSMCFEPHPRQELPMSTEIVSPLRQRMIEDMNARKLGAHSQRSHIYSCRRLAAFLKRSPDTATPDDVRRFQLHLAETGMLVAHQSVTNCSVLRAR